MITLEHVTKIYDGSTTAVDSISFEVQEGETFGLIGTSGCGKTTTLKMINRLIEPTSGEIFLNGESVINQPAEELRRNIGYVIQSIGLFPHYSIEENIAIVPKLLNWEQQQIKERSRELLELVGMEPDQYAGRKPEALSGGQQQRVGLARALAGDPEVLLMDEPFGALDPITKENIRGEFKKLLRELHKTVILVTHDVFEAFDLCDRICLMDQGKAQQIGTPKELLFQPQNDFVSSFFDSHRFQLEMTSVTMADFIQAGLLERPPSKGAQGDGIEVDIHESLLSVLESEGPNIIILEKRDTIFSVTQNELLKAFQQLRIKLKEDRHD